MRPPPEKVSCVNWRTEFSAKYAVAPFSNSISASPPCVARESPSCKGRFAGASSQESLPVCETSTCPSVRLKRTTRASSESWACATEEKKTRLDTVSKLSRTILGHFIPAPFRGDPYLPIRCGYKSPRFHISEERNVPSPSRNARDEAGRT